MSSAQGIGASIKRKEDRRFLLGKGQYTDDITLPGQTHAYFLRSPYAHARIQSLDTAAAAQAEGVLLTLNLRPLRVTNNPARVELLQLAPTGLNGVALGGQALPVHLIRILP